MGALINYIRSNWIERRKANLPHDAERRGPKRLNRREVDAMWAKAVQYFSQTVIGHRDGHTKGVKMGDTCTEQQADDWFTLEDVAWAERCVEKAVLPDVVMTDAEFDALVSLTFNIGCAGFQQSTVLKLVNAGSEDEAAYRHAFGMWNKQRGKELAGLTRRRAEEAENFLA